MVILKISIKSAAADGEAKIFLIRNGLINYYNKNHEDKDNIIKNIKSPYIKEYYDKLFKKKN